MPGRGYFFNFDHFVWCHIDIQILQAIAKTVACPIQFDGKRPLVKSSHVLIIKHKEIKLSSPLPIFLSTGRN